MMSETTTANAIAYDDGDVRNVMYISDETDSAYLTKWYDHDHDMVVNSEIQKEWLTDDRRPYEFA